jgi:sec-independent protein translocase protein TatA
MPNIGPLEIGIVLIIALIVFGPKRLPELGKSLGKGIKEFRGTIDGKHEPAEAPEAEQGTPIAVAVRPLEEAEPAARTRA